MIRWIAFDDDTAEAVVTRFKRGAAEIHHGQPLDAALDLGRPSVLLLPSNTPGRLLLARVEPKVENASKTCLAHEPNGFPELVGEPVFTQRPPSAEPATKKRWWRRRSA